MKKPNYEAGKSNMGDNMCQRTTYYVQNTLLLLDSADNVGLGACI